MKNVDESDDGAGDGDDHVDKNENVVDEHVDDVSMLKSTSSGTDRLKWESTKTIGNCTEGKIVIEIFLTSQFC